VGLLQSATALPVREVDDKDVLAPGRVYVAPADYHLQVEPGRFALSTDERVQYSRPSIDVALESAADAYGAAVVGVVLTGANADGAQGLAHVKRRGGLAVVQEPADAERATMPAAALAATAVDATLPLAEIGSYLAELCRTASSATVGGP